MRRKSCLLSVLTLLLASLLALCSCNQRGETGDSTVVTSPLHEGELNNGNNNGTNDGNKPWLPSLPGGIFPWDQEKPGQTPGGGQDPDVPPSFDYDFGGDELSVLTSDSILHAREWMASEESADHFSGEIFQRNMAVEQSLHVAILVTAANGGSIASKLEMDWLTGTQDYDVASTSADILAPLAVNGMLADLRSSDFSNMGLDKSFWYASFNSAAAVNGRQMFAAGALNTSVSDLTYSVFYNRNTEENFGFDLLTAVQEGQWTYALFEELCRLVTYEDRIGAVSYSGPVSSGFMHAFHIRFVEQQNNGYQLLEPSRTVSDAMQALQSLWYSGDASLVNANVAMNLFTSGKSLFYVGRLSDAFQFDASEYGVLPLPKYSEAQTNYFTGVSCNHSAVAVLAYPGIDSFMLGTSLGVICELSQYMEIGMFDLLSWCQEAEMFDMVELIRGSVYWDVSDVYSSYLGQTPWNYAFVSQTTIAASHATKRNAYLSKLLELWDKLG